MRGHSGTWTQGAALLVGAALGVLALAGWVVPGGTAAPPSALTLTAQRSDDLAVQPLATATVLRAELRPGGRAKAGSASLFNATGGALVVRVRALTSSHELDEAVELRVRLGARILFRGSPGELQRRGSRSFVLASHARVRLAFEASIPAGATGFGARVADVALRFVTSPARGSSS
jgi:hypothetical protein